MNPLLIVSIHFNNITNIINTYSKLKIIAIIHFEMIFV